MKQFWIAFGIGPNGGVQQNLVSSPYDTCNEAVNWARQKLADHHQTSKVVVCKAEFVAERTSPPVEVHKLTDIPAQEILTL